eukprot:6206243-Pleurochrysis_carterae.AAC.2
MRKSENRGQKLRADHGCVAPCAIKGSPTDLSPRGCDACAVGAKSKDAAGADHTLRIKNNENGESSTKKTPRRSFCTTLSTMVLSRSTGVSFSKNR